MFELIILGSFVGMLAGFFGIGGGTILVPLLLFFGVDIKEAVGIAVLQMVLSSIYGSYLNYKKGTLDVQMVILIGVGGFIGSLLSGYITSSVSNFTLEIIFLSFALFALVRVFFKTKEYKKEIKLNNILLISIGIPLGAISMAIGVGGSIILVPILAGFLHIPLKKAISAGLFFVVFSSIAGLISHGLVGNINYKSGVVIGVTSLVGVYFGIYLKDKVDTVLQRKLLIVFYIFVVSYLTYRIFLEV